MIGHKELFFSDLYSSGWLRKLLEGSEGTKCAFRGMMHCIGDPVLVAWTKTKTQQLPGVGFEPTPPTGDQNTQTVQGTESLWYWLKSGAFDHSAILATWPPEHHTFPSSLRTLQSYSIDQRPDFGSSLTNSIWRTKNCRVVKEQYTPNICISLSGM